MLQFCTLCSDATENYEVEVYKNFEEIDHIEWDKVSKGKNIYLCPAYLLAMQDSLKKDIQIRYLTFYKNKKVVAIAVVYGVKFTDKGRKKNVNLCRVRDRFYEYFFKTAEIDVLSCGTPFASGENGFAFLENEISEKDAYQNLGNALLELQKKDGELDKNNLILVKEFWQENIQNSKHIEKLSFRNFKIDVNMVMHIPHEWHDFEDYLQSLVTKFRTKAKSAISKSKSLTVKGLDVMEITKYSTEIDFLYQNVIQKSDFTFGELSILAFINLKKQLKDSFVFKGYFIDNQLVGFSTAFVCGDFIDANYVGIDYEKNQEYAIYQRMLYDYVELAINKKCKELRFGRTAEEIKSTIGAMPKDMTLYIRHKNSLTNKLLKQVFQSIKPSPFELRNPFKKEYLDKLGKTKSQDVLAF
jgi:predicted N-acyltransferase